MGITYTTIISPADLEPHLDNPDWVVIDCRFDLADPTAGEAAYRVGHIPGAVYAHLDRDLSGPKELTGRGGRHPLPSPAAMTRTFGRLGISRKTQVVAYDDTSGHYAARLWWMLRFMGHEAVAVLDGGWPGWQAAGLPVEAGVPVRRQNDFSWARHGSTGW
jgi:thiosulfate/3-mercaptopyruvate sulfurtransferase